MAGGGRGAAGAGPGTGEAGRRSSGPTPLGPTLARILSKTSFASREDTRVFEAWIQAVGPELARHARPIGFARGELRVQVDTSARFHELEGFTGEQHRAAANRILAGETIRRLAFKLDGR